MTGPAVLRSAARRRPAWPWLALGGAVLAAALSNAALDLDFAVLFDAQSRAAAFERSAAFVAAFGAPDLSAERLRQGFALTLSTFSIALWGTFLGVLLGYALALPASRAVWLGERRRGAGHVLRRGVLELARLALDVLRGVPDFAWALLILTVPGPGGVTGVLAIALGVGGVIGKIFSELWDGIPARRYEALRASGAGRAQVFLYAIQPLSARSMLSFTLMRFECSARNASVIGVVGGGGLGAQLFDEFNFGNYDGVVTLLLFLVALTASVDLASNFLRDQLRSDPNHPRAARAQDPAAARRRRGVALAVLLGLLAGAGAWLAPDVARARGELAYIEWQWIGEQLRALASPSLEARSWLEALDSCRVPLALACLATALGVGGAALLAYPGSQAFQVDAPRFTGERPGPGRRLARWASLVLARALTLGLRSVPEVAWLFVLAAFFRMGALAAVLAIGLHSVGVLGRVFVEGVDNLPYRSFEQAFQGSRARTFLYAAVPTAAREWSSYAFLQFETNLRAGLVVGIVGIGGLGERFHTSIESFNLPRASVFLIAMVLLSTVLDRTSRALKLGAAGVG